MKYQLLGGLLVVLVLGLVVPVPFANAISENYHKDWPIPFQENSTGFSYEVGVSMQTESDGKWILEKTYIITFTVSITYVNQTFFGSEGFSADFFSPELTEAGWNRNLEIVQNLSHVDAGRSGNLVVEYTPDTAFTKMHLDEHNSVFYQFMISFKVFIHENAFPYDYVVWQWMADHTIFMTFEKQTAETADYTTPILYVCIGIAVGAIPVGTYFIYKSRKSKGNSNNTGTEKRTKNIAESTANV